MRVPLGRHCCRIFDNSVINLTNLNVYAMRISSLKLKLISKRRAVKDLVVRANAARDKFQFMAAASLYEAAISHSGSARLHMQCGHMHKEARNFKEAEKHYRKVLSLVPSDPEIHLQMGHFYKTVGDYDRAKGFYREAVGLRPDWDVAAAEYENIENSKQLEMQSENIQTERADLLQADDLASVYIDTSLFPESPDRLFREYEEEFVITRMGGHQRTRWGEGSTVRGIDALRGFIISDAPCLRVDIYLDGESIYTAPLRPAPLSNARPGRGMKKYAYNAWIDFSKFSYGWHDITLKIENVKGQSREGLDWRAERIVVAPPLPEGAFESSDSIIPPRPADSVLSVEDWVNSQPSVAHRASSNSFPVKPERVLVQRLDQLGDLSVSVPALKRLRSLLPEAQIVGLLSPSNEGLGRSLGVFDEILTFDVPDDLLHQRRVLDRDGQLKLSNLLVPYKFDVAIDLAVAGVTQLLLPLSGAPVLLSYGGAGWKTIGFDMATHDPKSFNDVMRHSARTRALIETIGVWLDSGAEVVRRSDLDRGKLAIYGLKDEEDFIVLHAGARIKFTQWPYFDELASRLLAETKLKIVVMADGERIRKRLEGAPDATNRLIFIDGQLPFDDFDTFLSYCSVFVGNDSGPKHLAALRGAKVVSIHSSRINWNEWGQELTGVVMSRRVPCAGCSLHHNPDECAQGVACVTGITSNEVLSEVMKLLHVVPQ